MTHFAYARNVQVRTNISTARRCRSGDRETCWRLAGRLAQLVRRIGSQCVHAVAFAMRSQSTEPFGTGAPGTLATHDRRLRKSGRRVCDRARNQAIYTKGTDNSMTRARTTEERSRRARRGRYGRLRETRPGFWPRRPRQRDGRRQLKGGRPPTLSLAPLSNLDKQRPRLRQYYLKATGEGRINARRSTFGAPGAPNRTASAEKPPISDARARPWP